MNTKDSFSSSPADAGTVAQIVERLRARAQAKDVNLRHLVDATTSDLMLQAADLLEGWQPIETAPKDGTSVLMVSVTGFVDIYWWYVSDFQVEGWWSGRSFSTNLTHWMPLPSPPALCGLSLAPAGFDADLINKAADDEAPLSVEAREQAIVSQTLDAVQRQAELHLYTNTKNGNREAMLNIVKRLRAELLNLPPTAGGGSTP